MATKTLKRCLLFATFVGAPIAICAQGVDTIVEIPTTAHRSALIEIPTAQNPTGDSNNKVTMAGEYKSTKNVVEQQKETCWNWYADVGYTSEYNFRGTNLTPDADGAVFASAAVSKWGFTLGFFDIYQLGTARSPSFSMGEGGGGAGSGLGTRGVQSYTAETVQTRFNEIDVFLQYHRSFGPLEATVGNIGFFINRDAQTFLDITSDPLSVLPGGIYGPFATVQNEQFDRVYVRLATSVIPHIEPWITYYQTIYNNGEDHRFYRAPHMPAIDSFAVQYGNNANDNFHERNDRLGGYLEGRLRGHFSITDWVDFNPFGAISYSYHDRTEPIPGSTNFRDIIRGRSLVGWNVAQAGLEIPIHLFHIVGNSAGPCAPPDLHVDFVPGFTYSYHISRPTAGTDRDEVFGGAKIALTF